MSEEDFIDQPIAGQPWINPDRIIIRCQNCGIPFQPLQQKQRFHSTKCKNENFWKYHKRKVEILPV
jgi:hypothetical protein